MIFKRKRGIELFEKEKSIDEIKAEIRKQIEDYLKWRRLYIEVASEMGLKVKDDPNDERTSSNELLLLRIFYEIRTTRQEIGSLRQEIHNFRSEMRIWLPIILGVVIGFGIAILSLV